VTTLAVWSSKHGVCITTNLYISYRLSIAAFVTVMVVEQGFGVSWGKVSPLGEQTRDHATNQKAEEKLEEKG
jgi:hypothetical protein